ncbi:chemotaxis response regulator protein-glutamate methylesterase [Natronospirillum operosum]|uniref:Protein-glutamate methylesterase/protein-glutamine glutaminase n=1 Tax=Natronospirillum operosum TaxID=2759953 RepID=A0A4Z0WL43_9GAMM|nr:chemotaxis response regulator protein-glutamate methylesterase [Natronospirillum operosum]TGG95955.1 chemotaxis response regulator protein-glutamate methylesterase [Natronospirillum operosum]
MPISVLVVDDSAFFRQQIVSMLKGHPELRVAGTASHGKEAVEQALKLKPDVITMDYEMPIMDGISAVREIMARQPTPILMFSSLTTSGARVTLDALDAGAVDYLPKFRESLSANERLKQQLIEKLIAVVKRGGKGQPLSGTTAERTAPVERAPARQPRLSPRPELIMVGTSTGGPVALQKFLTQLPAGFDIPLLLIQHMPAAFTGPFAERLNRQCRIRVVEAQNNMALEPGLALLAPGGQQMMLSSRERVKVLAGDDRLNYKPSVDLSFGSAAKYYGNRVLAIVMTGMGADGREGARMLKKVGAPVWTQGSDSCVIDGMPAAIRKEGMSDADIPLDSMAQVLLKAL